MTDPAVAITGLYLTHARESKLNAARQILQETARALRMIATAGGTHVPELVNAAAQVEEIFDSLYVKPLADEPAPETARSEP